MVDKVPILLRHGEKSPSRGILQAESTINQKTVSFEGGFGSQTLARFLDIFYFKAGLKMIKKNQLGIHVYNVNNVQ